MSDSLSAPDTLLENKIALETERDNRNRVVASLPYKYGIHLNMLCNQSCIMCMPHGRHPKDTMPLEEFTRLFNQIKPYAEHLTLIGGEPLIYPWLEDVLDMIAPHKIAVTMNTNVTKLKPSILEKLMTLHQLNFKCSVHAPTEDLYWKIHGSKLFKTVQKNITAFAEAARDLPHIRQIFVYVIMKENLSGVLPSIDFVKPLSPYRIEFHTVKNVHDWQVENNTGWHFDGQKQSCEYIREDYNSIVKQAEERCEAEGISYEVSYV